MYILENLAGETKNSLFLSEDLAKLVVKANEILIEDDYEDEQITEHEVRTEIEKGSGMFWEDGSRDLNWYIVEVL